MQNGTWPGEVQKEGEPSLQDQCIFAFVKPPAINAADCMQATGKALRGNGVFIHRDLDALLATQFLEIAPNALLVGQQGIGKGGQQHGVVVIEGEEFVQRDGIDQGDRFIH